MGQAEVAGNDSDPAVTQEPPVPLVLVIATGESADKKKVALKFANGEIHDPPRDQRWYCWRPADKPIDTPIQEASLALSELLTALARGNRAESDLINELAKSHSDAALHRALRAALSSGMIKLHFGPGRFGQEAAATFSSRLDAALRRRCVVSLSKAGTLWVQSGNAPGTRKEAREAAGPKSKAAATNYIFQTYNTVVFPQGAAATGDFSPQRKQIPEEHPAITGSQRAGADKAASDARALTVLVAIGSLGGTLGSLFVNHPAQWQLAVFISTGVICAATLIFLIFAGLSAMMSRWRRRRRKVPGHEADAEPDPA